MRRCLLLAACMASLARADIPMGTPVQLTVLKPIGSLLSKVGDTVPLVVSHDVIVDGRVVLAEGTMVFAKVTKCRGEGAFSAAIFDKPARLCLSVDHLKDINGVDFKLLARPGVEGEVKITREMTATAPTVTLSNYQLALANTDTSRVIGRVHSLFSDEAFSVSERQAEVLVSHNIALPILQQSIKSGFFGQALDAVRDIKHKNILDTLVNFTFATHPSLIVLHALQEVGKFSGGLGTFVMGRFKGRNIHCPAGVELTLYSG